MGAGAADGRSPPASRLSPTASRPPRTHVATREELNLAARQDLLDVGEDVPVERRPCERPTCDVVFEVNPRAPHQRYCTRSCGDKVRADWRKAARRKYMKRYFEGYVRPSLRSEAEK